MTLESELHAQLSQYPGIPLEEPAEFRHQVRQINALLSHFMHIPFPEQLDDDTWFEKYRQFEWLLQKGFLNVKIKGNG